ALPRLPRRARAAVSATLALYDTLLADLAATPPERVLATRVRVSTPRKVAVLARTLAGEAVDAARSRGGRGERGAGARDGRDDGGAA
ncbi:MAG: hypothetical protein ABW025_10925, partial [Cellulomonas sp.]